MTAIDARLPATIEAVRRRIDRIDHWGVNSNLLADYDAMLRALADGYPAARISCSREIGRRCRRCGPNSTPAEGDP